MFERRELGEDEYWPEDLIGLQAVDAAGSDLGSVSDVVTGAQAKAKNRPRRASLAVGMYGISARATANALPARNTGQLATLRDSPRQCSPHSCPGWARSAGHRTWSPWPPRGPASAAGP